MNFFHHLNLSKTGAPENPPRNSLRNSLRNSPQKPKQDSEQIRSDIRSRGNHIRHSSSLLQNSRLFHARSLTLPCHQRAGTQVKQAGKSELFRRDASPSSRRRVKKSTSFPLAQEPQIALLFFCWVARVILIWGQGRNCNDFECLRKAEMEVARPSAECQSSSTFFF